MRLFMSIYSSYYSSMETIFCITQQSIYDTGLLSKEWVLFQPWENVFCKQSVLMNGCEINSCTPCTGIYVSFVYGDLKPKLFLSLKMDFLSLFLSIYR